MNPYVLRDLLVKWVDSECDIKCTECALYSICEVLTDLAEELAEDETNNLLDEGEI